MRERRQRGEILQGIALALLLLTGLAFQGLFFANMLHWQHGPDRGWISFAQLGPDIIWETRPRGYEAGLRKGDQILSLNGQAFETNEELLGLLDLEMGGVNRYEIKRGDEILQVSVTTGALGLQRVALQSGVFWLLGMLFIGIGLLVFLMKPFHGPSWSFFALAALFGVGMTYFAPSSTGFDPGWLNRVTLVIVPMLAAALIHLSVLFPQRKAFFASHWQLLVLPYLLSAGLAAASLALAPRAENLPKGLLTGVHLYVLAATVFFLVSTGLGYRRSAPVAVRLQSLVILTGLVVAFFTPAVEMVSNLVFRFSFFPNPILFYAASLIVFPISIGYAIVRHDLFEIDLIVRRTYGYLLSTAAIVALYGITVSGLNLAIGPSELTSSPFFSVTFVLAVVFLMQPLQGRIQAFVDRAFYRQQYDYRQTITKISETMTTLLDPELVQSTLVGSLVDEMLLENGILVTADEEAAEGFFYAEVVAGIEWPPGRSRNLRLDKALLDVLLEQKKSVFRHEIELAPQYAEHQVGMRESFDELAAELMFPMLYKGEVRGLLSLGRKKSGKMFTREDVDLLRTMINQSVIALENSRLFDDLADSLKQVQLLESVKSSLAKFVPQTVQDLLDESPEGEGLFDKREKDLSVMFADMTGYTRLSSQLPLDEVNAIVERYFGAFLDEILSHGGDVNETAGDGLMVLFQNDDPEEHARAAVRAALGIQRLTREINAERSDGVPIGMHIGVNSGVAMVGATKITGGGGGMRWTYTASGPVTNISARVGALGEEIAITEDCYRRLGSGFQVAELGPQSLKNVKDPVNAFRVEAELASQPVAEPAPVPVPEATALRDDRFLISGELRDQESQQPLSNLIVRAFDRDLLIDDDLGHARSDAAGRFEIEFTEEFFGPLEKHPDIYLKIYDASGKRELLSTHRNVRWNAGREEHFALEIPAAAIRSG